MSADPSKNLPTTPVKSYGPTSMDRIFMAFLVVMLGIMLLIGRITYIEGSKIEVGKSNGEAWAEWFKKTSLERFKAEFQPSACAAGQATAPIDVIAPAAAAITGAGKKLALALKPSAPQSPAANTWGNCLKALMAEGPLSELRNPFTGQRPEFIEKCDFSNRKLAGGLILEKLTPTLPGMAIPVVASQLVDADVITQKLQLRLTVCDGGAYPIPIASMDF